MQLLRTSRLAAVFALTLMAGPLSAQAYHWDANVNGGYQGSTNALSEATILDNNAVTINPLILTNNGTVVSTTSNAGLAFKPSGIFGAQIGYWFTKNIGTRLNAAYSPSGFKQHSGEDLINSVNLWSGTADLMLRMVQPRPKFTGVEWLPYAALGLGAQGIAPGNHAVGVAVANDTFSFATSQVTGDKGAAIVCVRGFCRGPSTGGFAILGHSSLPDTATFFVKQTARFAGLLGLGMDIRVTRQFAIRIEGGDRLWSAPVYRAVQRDSFTTAVFLRDRIGKTVNQFYATAGANVLWGLEPPPPEPVAVQPAPPPPPPAPAPVTESINVCVVDPSVNGGLKSVDALRNLNTGDTTVVSNGSTVSLSSTLPGVPVVADQDWFQSGRPLEIGTTADKIQFVTTGGARVIDAADLAFLGTVNGLPVYADRTMMGPIEGLTPGTDLSTTVDTRPLVRRAIEEKIPVVYVPLKATGCVFQPMQMLEKVRKQK